MIKKSIELLALVELKTAGPGSRSTVEEYTPEAKILPVLSTTVDVK
jgi:hypothetical protein